jgi:hypothetical protein
MGNFNGWNFQNTPMQVQQPQTTTLRTIQQVEGEFGIKAYPLRPGESVIAIDTTADDILWIKICNANGVPTIQKLKYGIEDTYNPNDSNYVSKKDFNELSAKLDKVLEELNNGNKQSNTQPVKSGTGNTNPAANTNNSNNAKSSNFNDRSKNAAG